MPDAGSTCVRDCGGKMHALAFKTIVPGEKVCYSFATSLPLHIKREPLDYLISSILNPVHLAIMSGALPFCRSALAVF